MPPNGYARGVDSGRLALNQLVVAGTLADIVESRDVRPPAVFVVGEVVRLTSLVHS
jgi:siroheme synthase